MPLGEGRVTFAVGSEAVCGPIGMVTGADTVGTLAITVSGAVGSVEGVGLGATVCAIFGACATGRTFAAAIGAGVSVGDGSGGAHATDTSSAIGVLGFELLLMPQTKAIPSTA